MNAVTSRIRETALAACAMYSENERGQTVCYVPHFAPGEHEWIIEMNRAAHGDMLPDDFRYRVIREALGFIGSTENDVDLDDMAAEFADDVDVDVYTLTSWLASNLSRTAYCDDAVADYGATSLASILTYAQSLERREVWDAVISAVAEQAEAQEEN